MANQINLALRRAGSRQLFDEFVHLGQSVRAAGEAQNGSRHVRIHGVPAAVEASIERFGNNGGLSKHAPSEKFIAMLARWPEFAGFRENASHSFVS